LSLRCLAGLRGREATLELRQGLNFYKSAVENIWTMSDSLIIKCSVGIKA